MEGEVEVEERRASMWCERGSIGGREDMTIARKIRRDMSTLDMLRRRLNRQKGMRDLRGGEAGVGRGVVVGITGMAMSIGTRGRGSWLWMMMGEGGGSTGDSQRWVGGRKVGRHLSERLAISLSFRVM